MFIPMPIKYPKNAYINKHLHFQGPTWNITRSVVPMTRQTEWYVVQTAKLCHRLTFQMMDLVESCWLINQLSTLRIDEKLTTTQTA